MTIVICDSSFLILISKLEILNLLITLFDNIIIPIAVFKETVEKGKDKKKMDAFLIEKYIKEEKIIVKKIKKSSEKTKLMEDFNIYEGEAEAILLYMMEKANLLGTDDFQSIKVCKIFNIRYFSTLSFLQICYSRNKLTKNSVLSKYNKLNEIGWYNDELINYFKNKIKNKED